MLGKIYTKAGEENFIQNIIKNALAIDSLPKYVILRLAINKTFRLEHKRLDNPCLYHTMEVQKEENIIWNKLLVMAKTKTTQIYCV